MRVHPGKNRVFIASNIHVNKLCEIECLVFIVTFKILMDKEYVINAQVGECIQYLCYTINIIKFVW